MLLEDLFKTLARQEASDLLITANTTPHIRVGGRLKRIGQQVLKSPETKEMLHGILTEEQRETLKQEKSVDLSFCYWDSEAEDQDNSIYRFRVNVFYQQGHLSAAFRAIPRTLPTLEELGLPPVLREISSRYQGLVLVTGPTGHGKSTTMAAMIDLINSNRAEHIITVEDPVEYIHPHKKSVIEQRELGRDTPSFQSALKYVLRQDPDVILVGEMRDLETISCALTAAETGHLVFATLHTNDAMQTIERIVDIFPAEQQGQVRTQLALSLTAIISQRLLPAVDGGRAVACEVMLNDSAISNLIREGKTHQMNSVIETRSKEKMIAFDKAVKDLYEQGLITYEVAMQHMRKPDRLQKIMI